jgi:hypothetical protein
MLWSVHDEIRTILSSAIRLAHGGFRDLAGIRTRKHLQRLGWLGARGHRQAGAANR